MQTIDGITFAKMINAGAASLKAHTREVNELNVFPIPDGDTGDNMLLTVLGGARDVEPSERLCEAAEKASNGMLLSARGNSGVILSQFFEGISNGLKGVNEAGVSEMRNAFKSGVRHAYEAVMTPTEGTILTVAREATEYACMQETEAPEEFLDAFISEAKRSLARTPELLPVLKKAGVVDSGAAGLIYIAEGMKRAALGEEVTAPATESEGVRKIDLDAFDENSVLEFGYCTELLLRLQNAKTDVKGFDVNIITDYLETLGDSIVAFKNGSTVKLHVHTKTPDRVLAFCQRFGEFLKVKIENMSLQHNNTVIKTAEAPQKERKKYGTVAVAQGDGLKKTFSDMGADVVVDGGQSMNPSTEAFLEAFREVNADTVFVFPNNGNIILTAKQAARLFKESDVRVIESTTVGAGYASLSMLDTGSGDVDGIVSELTEAMQGVVTAEVSHCVRNAVMDGTEMHTGDYIGFVGKKVLAVGSDRLEAVYKTLDKLGFDGYDICIAFCGRDASAEESKLLEEHIHKHYKGKEAYIIDGGQDIYDYILILE